MAEYLTAVELYNYTTFLLVVPPINSACQSASRLYLKVFDLLSHPRYLCFCRLRMCFCRFVRNLRWGFYTASRWARRGRAGAAGMDYGGRHTLLLSPRGVRVC